MPLQNSYPGLCAADSILEFLLPQLLLVVRLFQFLAFLLFLEQESRKIFS